MAKDGRPAIDAALAERLVAAQFPQWRGLAIRPVAFGGWDNRTFHLGETMLVRLPSAGRYAAQVDKEQQWLPLLAPNLPVAIPTPLAAGGPAEGYPWRWSIYAWLPGETADRAPIADARAFAADLARFLAALQRIDPAGGPAAGAHSFHRGGSLAVYDAQAREAIDRLNGRQDGARLRAIWDEAMAAERREPPVWVHGDFAPRNLLVREGRLAAVIDFGGLAVGDPACDLAMAWTFLSGDGRLAFRDGLAALDEATWARGRGWALWKAAILASGVAPGPADDVREAERVLAEVVADPISPGGARSR